VPKQFLIAPAQFIAGCSVRLSARRRGLEESPSAPRGLRDNL